MTMPGKAEGKAKTSPFTRLYWCSPLLTAVGYQRKMNSNGGFRVSWVIRNLFTFTVWVKWHGEPYIYTHLEVMRHPLLQAKMGSRRPSGEAGLWPLLWPLLLPCSKADMMSVLATSGAAARFFYSCQGRWYQQRLVEARPLTPTGK